VITGLPALALGLSLMALLWPLLAG